MLGLPERRTRIAGILLVLLAITSLTAACTDKNDQFIQGRWYYRDPHLDSVSGEQHLEIEWLFDRGTFEYYACCFNVDELLKGRYRIKESADDVITLELFNVGGRGLGIASEIRIVIDRDTDTLSIMGGRPFTRVFALER